MSKQVSSPSLHTVDVAARLLGYSVRHVRRLTEGAGISPVEIGSAFFWSDDDLEVIREYARTRETKVPTGIRVPCPFYEEPIGREECQAQSTVLRKNQETCCVRGCPSPWRPCAHCLLQGYTQRDNLVIDPVKGSCEFHAAYGPKADRKYPSTHQRVVPTAEEVSVVQVETGARILVLDTATIRPDPKQPRSYFDPAEMQQLEKSILRRGQLQPGIVRALTGDPKHRYELVDGERRFRACSNLKVRYRAILEEPKDAEDQFEMQLVANFQRSEHTPMEIANGIHRLVRKARRSEADVAELLGRSQSWVNYYHRLVRLDRNIQKYLDPSLPRKQQLPLSIATQLAFLPIAKQMEQLKIIQGKKMSALAAVQHIKKAEGGKSVGGDDRWRREPRKTSGVLMTFARATRMKAEWLVDQLTTSNKERMFASRPKDEISRMTKELRSAIDALEKLYQQVTT